MAGWKAHLGPDRKRWARQTVTAIHVLLVGAIVVEQIELDQFDALIFQIDKRAGNTAVVLAGAWTALGMDVSGTPVVLPIDLWLCEKRDARVSAGASGLGLSDLSQEPFQAVGGDRTKTFGHQLVAIRRDEIQLNGRGQSDNYQQAGRPNPFVS